MTARKISARLQLALDIMSQIDLPEKMTEEEMQEVTDKIDDLIEKLQQPSRNVLN